MGRGLGHVPIIDPVPRSKNAKHAWAMEKKARPQVAWQPAEARRLARRPSCERVNSRLKNQFGGNNLRVRGPTKAMCHLMFGILALTIDRLNADFRSPKTRRKSSNRRNSRRHADRIAPL